MLFVHAKRDPATDVASVLKAKKCQLGSETAWYSFKTPEYHELKNLALVAHATGHIHCINRAIFDQIVGKLKLEKEAPNYSGLESFNLTRDKELSNRAEICR